MFSYSPYLGFSKTLSWTLWYKNVDLARKDISNKLMIFGNEGGVQRKKVMFKINQGLQNRGGKRRK